MDLVIAVVMLVLSFSIITTDTIAALCLILYAVLVVAQYQSADIQSLFEQYPAQLSLVKLVLLLIAFADLLLL